MAGKIAFVSRLEDDEAREWLEALRSAMPEGDIAAFSDLSEAERAAVDIAVVANPDPEDVRLLPNLQWIHSVWAGVEKLVAVLPDRVPLVRLVDPELSRAMGEAVLAWVYYLQRDMPAYAAQQARKEWRPLPYRAPQDVTVAVLGLGEMGLAAAERLQAAGFKVAGWSRGPKSLGFKTFAGDEGLFGLLEVSDISVCLVPLTKQTRGLIDARAFAAMRYGAALINFARGPVVDTQDLLAALEGGQVGHAVLDVFDQEPLAPDSPLWAHPKVTVLPHISGPTTVATAAEIVARNIRSYRLTGELPPVVDRARGY